MYLFTFLKEARVFSNFFESELICFTLEEEGKYSEENS